ncbi:MAG TPA: AsmA family protein [Nevskiales bacterium]|nr:AsmA family protein [Nevskiales bacterium]
MKIIVKIVLGLLGLLLVSGIALAVFLPLYFDPNDYKAEIAQKVKAQTGREFTLKGDIRLSVFPWLGMQIGEASLGNAPGFGAEPFAAVRAAELRVKLLPLLRREIQIGTVVLDGLALRLQKNAVGQNNWDDIGPQKKPDEPSPAQDKPSEFKLESLEVAALEIRDSTVLWSDAQSGDRYELRKFDFSTGKLRSAEPFLLRSEFELTAGKPAVSSRVALEGKVNADLERKTYRIDDFELKAEVAGEKLPGGKQPLSLTGAVDLDLKNQKLSIKDLVLEAFTLKVTGQANGSQILDKPAFSGQIKAADINPRAVLKALGKEEPKTADGKVLTRASFESGFTATGERADLSPIRIKLDDSSLEGRLSVANYSKPAIGFDLKVDEIDMDRYLAPPDEKDGAGGGGGKAEEGEVGVDAIKDLNLNGSLNVGKLKVKNLRFENANLSLRAQDGVMVIEPLSAGFYQGRINLSGRLDARGSRPAYALNAQTSGIRIEPMLTDLTGKAKVSGTATLNLDISTAGARSSEFKRALNGTLSFRLLDGEIKGFNLGHKLRQAQAMRKGERLADDAPQTTDFAEISGTLNIVNGVLRNNDLDGKSPAFRVNGEGSANLVNETIDYLAKVFVVKTSKGQGGEALADLEGVSIPVRLTGNLYAPDWKIDLGSALKEKAEEKLEQEKEKAKQKLLDKLGIGGSSSRQPAPDAGGATATEPSGAPAQSTEPAPAPEEKSDKERLKEEALRRLLD